jgi:acyl-CoA thioesterase II
VDFQTMMALESHGPDTFVGAGPSYPWGGLYGGQIVAQGLRAAGLTIDDGFHVHSLHAYFVRRGDSSEPIRFEVDRVRNGRSFTTRTVVARQSTGAILTMTASFNREEEAPAVQSAVAPDVPPADDLPPDSWTEIFDRRTVPASEVARAQAWTRVRQEVGDDPLLHACGIAYVSDDMPTDAVRPLDPRWDPASDERQFMSASLDHAIWFHRPMRADAWHLQDFRAGQLMGARSVAVGELFGADGVHLATVAQEVLMRKLRTG